MASLGTTDEPVAGRAEQAGSAAAGGPVLQTRKSARRPSSPAQPTFTPIRKHPPQHDMCSTELLVMGFVCLTILFAVLVVILLVVFGSQALGGSSASAEPPGAGAQKGQAALYPWETGEANVPLKRVAFMRRGAYEPEDVDITLVTQTTPDRFHKLVELVLSWKGPVSVSVYIKDPYSSYQPETPLSQLPPEIRLVLSLYDNSPALSWFVDVHFVYANGTRYPANVLRNFAIARSRTPVFLMLDIDFVTSQSLHDHLREFLLKT